MGEALYILRHSITGGKAPLQYVKTALAAVNPGPELTAVLAFSMGLLLLFDFANEKGDAIQIVSKRPVFVRWTVYAVFVFLLLLLIPKGTPAPFIYFQF